MAPKLRQKLWLFFCLPHHLRHVGSVLSLKAVRVCRDHVQESLSEITKSFLSPHSELDHLPELTQFIKDCF